MKKLLFYLTLFVFTLSGFSQPLTPYAPNVIVHDINGVEHNLYTYLDQNRTVVLEFYNSTNTASINSRPGVEDLYTMYGLGGDLSHAILSIDLDSTTNTEAAFQAAYGISSAITDSVQKFTEYNPDVNTPMFIIICPDRLWKVRYGSIFNDESYITSMSSSCAELSSLNTDGKILEYFGNTQYCSGETEALFYVQNYSMEDPLTSAKIVAKEGGIERGSVVWTGYLEPYEIDTVVLPLSGIGGVDILTFELEEVNGITDSYLSNNSFIQTLNEGKEIKETFNMKLTTDFNPDQIRWYIIQDATGDTISDNFNHTYLPNTLYEWDFNFSLFIDGCYEFFIEDTFGDGLINGTTPEGQALGNLVLTTDVNDQILLNDIGYEHGTSRKFSVNKSLGTIEFEETSILLAKNPIGDQLTVTGLSNDHDVVKVYTVDGKYIDTYKVLGQEVSVNTQNWENGIYIINVLGKNGSTILKAIK